jgi:Ni,Fe-hydrogenase III large subunit
MERLAHHMTDLGFIPNDAGFASALSFMSMKTEELRRELAVITSHRFGFGAVRGRTGSFDENRLRAYFEKIESEMHWFEEWITDIPSLWDRFDTTGVLTPSDARKYGVTGVMARASGIAADRREGEFYRSLGFEIQAEEGGDVAARFKIRLKELFNSIEIAKNTLGFEEARMEFGEFTDGEYSSFVESSIGELMLFVRIENGRVDRFFARDPSFVNWQALHLMMPGNIIADFPLINKSCDLSYAGNDL